MPLFFIVDNSLSTGFQLDRSKNAENGQEPEYSQVFAYVLKPLKRRESLLTLRTFTPNLSLNQIVDIPEDLLLEFSVSNLTVDGSDEKLQQHTDFGNENVNFPFVDHLKVVDSLFQPAAEKIDPLFMPKIRASLISEISHHIGEDELAAEYLLLFLISKRTWSKARDFSIDGFSLKLAFPHSNICEKLVSFISNIAHHSLHLPLSLQLLNDAVFYSKYHPSEDTSITPGDLHLPSGSVVILDTFQMNEGKLEKHGVQNYSTLLGALSSNTMNCVPSGQVALPFSFDLDLHFLILTPDLPVVSSDKSKPEFLPADINIPLKPLSNEDYSTDFDFEVAQCYIAKAKSLLSDFVISKETGELITQTFVNDRQEAKKKLQEGILTSALMLNEEDLHKRLVLSKSIAVSHGSATLLPEHFEQASTLQKKLFERLDKYQQDDQKGH